MENNDYNLNDEPNLPLDDNDKNVFGLPSDYFASFEDKLRKKLESQEELNEFPILSSILKNNLFTTPVDYFATAENKLEAKTELSAYAQLQSIKPFVPVELDSEYTTHLQSAINYKVELAEELKEYKTLYALDKVNPFIASDAYFESIAERVKNKIYSVKETKATVLNSVLDFIFGKKMAFAFSIVFIISLSLYLYQSSEKPLEMGDCKTLACLERQEILNNNKVISNFDEEQLMDLVDVNKLNVDSISEDDLLDEL
jgi:hypothetical protein